MVIFLSYSALARLLGGLKPTVEIIDSKAPIPQFDYHVPLLSMPFVFKTGPDDFLAEVPYLRAEADRVGKWKDKIGSAGFKVGISWQGRSTDIARSFPVRLFEPLSKVPGVRLISLQRNEGVEQLLDLPPEMTVESLGDEFDIGPDAFIDTAAVMESLDLVITLDSSIAHLAGALARPTWVALKYSPDWRRLLDRSDCLWYPTMRLFRQPSFGDWRTVFAEMEAQLAQLIDSRVSQARISQLNG